MSLTFGQLRDRWAREIGGHLGLTLFLLLAFMVVRAPRAAAHGLEDQIWETCTSFGYATDFCDCDTGDPEVCCMGQGFAPSASTLSGVDLYLSGPPDAEPNEPFSTFVTVNVRMTTINGALLGSATAPLNLTKALDRAWVHFDFPAALTLSPVIRYVLEVRSAPQRVMWLGSSASSCGGEYTGGAALTAMETGCCDFNFKTYGGFIAGGGPRATDCTHEWLTNPAPRFSSQGVPKHRLECTDDDPACDFGSSGDKACTFHVAQCFNVADIQLPCGSTDVAAVRLPSGKKVTDVANRQALEDALVARGGVVSGRCGNSGPQHGNGCGVNSECDSAPGGGDGVCRDRFVAFVPALATSDACTASANITVPLRQSPTGRFATGRKKLKIKAIPSAGRSDTDSLTLICNPHP